MMRKRGPSYFKEYPRKPDWEHSCFMIFLVGLALYGFVSVIIDLMNVLGG